MLRFLTAGESHGPKLTAILEGMPAGIPLGTEQINSELSRRQKGCGAGPRMAIESDSVKITSGVLNNQTTGGPIALEIENKDFINWQGKLLQPVTIPRPGHADLTGAIKYGYKDFRLSAERSSARETAIRVAVGSICRIFLRQFGIYIGGYVVQIGKVCYNSTLLPNDKDFIPSKNFNPDFSYYQSFSGDKDTENIHIKTIMERILLAQDNDVRCPDIEIGKEMAQSIAMASQAGDSLGGIIEVVAIGVPPGLGSFVHYDRRIDAKLAGAIMSIPAVKGVSIGNAFDHAAKLGSESNDALEISESGKIYRNSNFSGGIEGGISNGEPIFLRVAFKPIPTFPKGMPSVDFATGQPHISPFQRSDSCPVPRAVPVTEAVMAIVLADLFMEKFGGDSLEEIIPRFQNIRQALIKELEISSKEWQFLY